MFYLEFLRQVHDRLAPERYLEIGVRWGHSLGLSRCASVAIDPAFVIDQELHTEVHLFKTTADEYFSRPDPLEPVGGRPFDFAFIDGMHLLEYALRDLIHAERFCRPGGLIVFDDILPRNVTEAARVRTTGDWTGDVYSLVPILHEYRPDLLAIAVGTAPTGLLLLAGLDPADTTLEDRYDEIVARFRHPDPQPVPGDALARVAVQPPHRVLGSGLVELLRSPADAADLPERLRALAHTRLGPAYAC